MVNCRQSGNVWGFSGLVTEARKSGKRAMTNDDRELDDLFQKYRASCPEVEVSAGLHAEVMGEDRESSQFLVCVSGPRPGRR